MNEFSEIICFWEQRNDQPMALATLVRVRGSSYRQPGARMLITSKGASAGSLSAGCIEEEVIAAACEVMRTRKPQLMSFDTRRRFGCNGSIEVFVECAPRDLLIALAENLSAHRTCEVVTVFENSDALGTRILYGYVEPGAFIQPVESPLRLVIIGDGPDTIALRAHATLLDWETIVIHAISELHKELDERTAVVVATHNFGRDCAALRYLLPLGLRYVGLVGPRRRRDEILSDVIDSGAELHSELFAPAGLDLAAETPQQIALAIVAEIQSVIAGGTGENLRDRKAPIHATTAQWATSAR
jgi:xanthine/CO dehydrogenase XdhC/CoxF family maturation factor